jgi:hypothetical protein
MINNLQGAVVRERLTIDIEPDDPDRFISVGDGSGWKR